MSEKTTSLWKSSVIMKWVFFGPILLLLGVIAELNKGRIMEDYVYIYSILYEFLKNIGIAITISSIFSYIMSTVEFIEFIKTKLISIIISKEFVNRLNNEERKDLLSVILRPTKALSSIYSGISSFFNNQIEESLKLFHHPFRSAYTIFGEAYFDNQLNLVTIEYDMNFRMYKVMGDFEQLSVGFEDDTSKVVFTKIMSPSPHNKEHIVTAFNEEQRDQSKVAFLQNDTTVKKCVSVTIPQDFKQYDQLDVLRRVKEIGQDHWHLFSYRASAPCDKFSLSIRCRDNIRVKKCVTYGPSEDFKISNEGHRIDICCSDWMKAGLGVAILFACDNYQEPSRIAE